MSVAQLVASLCFLFLFLTSFSTKQFLLLFKIQNSVKHSAMYIAKSQHSVSSTAIDNILVVLAFNRSVKTRAITNCILSNCWCENVSSGSHYFSSSLCTVTILASFIFREKSCEMQEHFSCIINCSQCAVSSAAALSLVFWYFGICIHQHVSSKVLCSVPRVSVQFIKVKSCLSPLHFPRDPYLPIFHLLVI